MTKNNPRTLLSAEKAQHILSDRLALMRRMREADITDTQIAKVFDLSRERIRQLLGNGGKFILAENPELVAAIRDDLLNSDLTQVAIESKYGVSDSTVKTVRQSIPYRDRQSAIVSRRKRRYTNRLREFVSTLNGNKSTSPIELMRYDRTLYHHALVTFDHAETKQIFANLGIDYISQQDESLNDRIERKMLDFAATLDGRKEATGADVKMYDIGLYRSITTNGGIRRWFKRVGLKYIESRGRVGAEK